MLRPDLCQPVLRRRYSAQVFFYVLLGNVADRHFDTVVVRDRDAEDPFCQENALGVMSKRAMPEVSVERL